MGPFFKKKFCLKCARESDNLASTLMVVVVLLVFVVVWSIQIYNRTQFAPAPIYFNNLAKKGRAVLLFHKTNICKTMFIHIH